MPTQHADRANAPCAARFLSRTARVLSLAAVVLLAGCAQTGGSGTSAPPAFGNTPDPYHYHCDEACQNGLGG